MRAYLLAAAAAAVALPATAKAGPGDVNAQEFYLDAKELQSKGMKAIFDKRTRPRMAQLKAAATVVKAENEAATKKGTPVYCVSAAERKKGMDADQVIAMLGRVPEAQRRKATLTAAWRAALIREYPCN